MVARLTLAGIRSLGILIDITNYVMLELGQPLHGYDLDTLTGGITVRRASAGEKLETLDGKVRDLARRRPAHHRRVRPDRPGRRHGRRHDRDDRGDPQRAASRRRPSIP